jgi:hypothetical protein
MRDLILAVRADESIHRDINHKFSDLGEKGRACEVLEMFLKNDHRLTKRQQQGQQML